MTDHPRFQLNRALVVLRYKQPYIDWVRTARELPIDLTLEEANDVLSEPGNELKPKLRQIQLRL